MKALITCLVAGVHYLIHPQKLGSIQETINPDSIIPVTLLSTDEIFGDVDGLLRLYDVYDDVFIPEFGSILVEKPGNDTDLAFVHDAGKSQVQQLYHLEEVLTAVGVGELPSGPYFLHGPNLHQAWRLYEDTQDAFTFGVVPDDVNRPDGFQAVNSLTPSGAFKSIPVPSRLYKPPSSSNHPLSGMRVSITDTLSLKGVHTSLSSRAWQMVHTSADELTARIVQDLLDLGAVIVGKTKTSQFDAGREWIDAAAPWNPRADGYQAPPGGSAGAVSAMVAYDWLEHSIGQDSIEGLRNSTVSSGLITLRTSADSLPLEGLHGLSSTYDAIGLSSRNIDSLIDVASTMLKVPDEDMPLPMRIGLPLDLLPEGSEAEKSLSFSFLARFENILGIKAEPIILADVWRVNPPAEANGLGMQEFIQGSPFLLFCHEFYHTYDGFREECEESFHQEPFQEPTVRLRWELGKNISDSVAAVHRSRVEVFRKWFDEFIMQTGTVLLFPWPLEEPRYRDNMPEPPTPIQVLTPEFLAPILGAPQLLVPFAQLPYESRISGRTEYRPVTGSVMGPRGGDLMLARLVKRAFELAEWRTRVETGALTFPLGNNPRNVDDLRARPVTVAAPASHLAQEPLL